MAVGRHSGLRAGSKLAYSSDSEQRCAQAERACGDCFYLSTSEREEPRMSAIDITLQEREAAGRPIRVGMIGAGATGRAIALQLGTPVTGIRLAAIANRTPEHGER